MSTLWTFGDSFTESYNEKYIWAKDYIQWKGYTPKVYSEILSEELNTNLMNLAVGGSDNYTILHSFINVIEQIQLDDILIFGWSSVVRFRLADDLKNWKPLLPNYNNNLKFLKDISKETIDEILVNRTSSLYINEVNNYIKLINHTLKNNLVIHWTPFKENLNALNINDIQTIRKETNGEINDGHYSENGHIELSNVLKNTYHRKKNKDII